MTIKGVRTIFSRGKGGRTTYSFPQSPTSRPRRTLALPAAAVVLWLFALPSPADSGGPPSLDEPSLDAQLLEDAPTDSPAPNVLQGLFPPTGPTATEDPYEQLRQKVRSAILRDETNPLVSVARRMQRAELLIGQIDSGTRTQEIQRDIVANLDELIKQAQKQCGSCKPSPKQRQVDSKDPSQKKEPGKEPKPSPADPDAKPSSDSQAQPGSSSVERPDMGEMETLAKSIWGELPEVARQQMLEPLVEQFLPKYELLIEQYYKRLAKQQGVVP